MKYRRGTNQYKKRPQFTTGQQIGTILFGSIVFMGVLNSLFPTPINASESTTFGLVSPLASAESKQAVLGDTATPAATLITKPQTREEKVKAYLEGFNSPLAPYAEYMVEMADKYDISYTLSASIAYKESTLGKHIREGSHNAWGIMSWDENGKRSIRMFKSWKEAIKYHAALLSGSYRENMNKAIQEKYCPSFECSDTWVKDVTNAQKEINSL